MTILVTGAGGFLGGHLCRKLRESGRHARGYDLVYPGGQHEDDIVGSILDPEALSDAFDDVTGVIHAAAIAHLWTPGRFDYDRVNGVGTCRVLAQARRIDVPLVMVSSYTTLISKDAGRGDVLDEATEIVPNNLCGRYPRSKRQAELFVQSAAGAGQRACIVMPSAPVGTGDYNMTPPSELIRDLALGRVPALLECQLDLVDVEAVADASITALDRGEPGRRYLLSGEGVSLPELAARIGGLTGRSPPSARVPMFVALMAARVEAAVSRVSKRPPRAPLTGVRIAARPVSFASERARAELGYAPRPLDEVLPEAVEWLLARPDQ
ncbi:MAG: NAD-dependent epimerase/dehydratase family protein [Pseudomonadota bacterium]